MIGTVQLAVGLGLLVLGGYWVVGGSASLARRLGIPPLVIGITVLAFGTSAPELAVNLAASLEGTGAVAFGNIVGSNIANVGLILAIAAVIRPLSVQRALMTRDMPMMVLATVLALGMGFTDLGVRTAGVAASYLRIEGALFLLLFCAFVFYTARDAVLSRRGELAAATTADTIPEGVDRHGDARTLRTTVSLVAGGLLALALGGSLTVDGALHIAGLIGLPEAIVGLTIIAIGTSLPELSATIVAAARGEADLAVGNVVGSNIFNLLLVLGLSSAVRPVPVPVGGEWDLAAMTLFAIAPLLLAATGRQIAKGEGAVLLAGYVVFVWFRVV